MKSLFRLLSWSRLIVFSCLFSLVITPIANATSGTYDPSFYSSNNIFFYNPTDTGCVDVTASIVTSPSSKGNQEAAAKFFTSTNFLGNGDKPMNAVQMAAIMGNIQQESGFNPSAGLGGSHTGIIQWNSPGRWNSIADPKTDLNNQLNFIKTELDGGYKGSLSEFWSASAPADLNKATFAITRNYEVAIKGSVTIPTSWTDDATATSGLQDWTKRIAYAQTAYNTYGNLAGSSYTPGARCAAVGSGNLVTGGMTLDKGTAFMNEYKSLQPTNWPRGTAGTPYDINGTSCSGGSLANCVALSQYFINRYTTKKYVHTSDGRGVVKDLLALGFTDGGHTPKAYAIFSRGSGSYGHTGVVLGIDTTRGTILIGEASCGDPLSWVGAHMYSLSKFSSSDYTYAYTDSLLKGGVLQ